MDMSHDFDQAELKFKSNCKAALEEMQEVKQQGLVIYDN